MPRMPNVNDADLISCQGAADRFVDEAHELISRIEKGYVEKIDGLPSHAKRLAVIAEAASTLAKQLLIRHEMQEMRSEVDALRKATGAP